MTSSGMHFQAVMPRHNQALITAEDGGASVHLFNHPMALAVRLILELF